jgi:hypothetical protein
MVMPTTGPDKQTTSTRAETAIDDPNCNFLPGIMSADISA